MSELKNLWMGTITTRDHQTRPNDHGDSAIRPKRGFTLVELVVVIAILSILVAVLLPASQAAREAARRIRCTQNLHEIGIALHNHHSSFEEFPMGGLEWRGWNQPNRRQLAWSLFLLPFLEQQALWDKIDTTQAFDSPANAVAASNTIPFYICPSGTRGKKLSQGRGPIDYGGLYGERLSGPNNPPKGIMIYEQAFAAKDVSDGLSNTICIGESVDWPDGQWINGRNLFDQAFPIHQAPFFENDLRSLHPNGVNVGFADGHARFLRETTDVNVLSAICTRNGHEVVTLTN